MGSPCSKREKAKSKQANLLTYECLSSSALAGHDVASQLLSVRSHEYFIADQGAEFPVAVASAPPRGAQELSSCRSAPPSCPWLDEVGLSLAERARRQLVLRRVCKRILATSPEQRPRSLAAFANFTGVARRVRTYTVPPAELLQSLQDVPEEVSKYLLSQPRPSIIPESLLETPCDKTICQAASRWNRLCKQVRGGGIAEQVRWIQAHAYVQCEYAAQQVAEALCDLQIVGCGSDDSPHDFHGQAMLEFEVRELMPVPEFLPETPWSTYRPKLHTVVRRVPLPAGCARSFVGSGGAAVKSLISRLQLQAQKTDVMMPLSIHLNTKMSNGRDSAGMVELRVEWQRWERKAAALEAATRVLNTSSELAHVLSGHICEIYVQLLARSAGRRDQRAKNREEWGRVYHEERRTEREQRRACTNDSAIRGLQLPPAGISRCPGAPRPNRKDVAQQRRRVLLQQKRKRLLQACDELHGALVVLPCTAKPALSSSGSMRLPPHTTGAARRLLRHLHSCKGEVAEQALDSLNACCAAAHRQCPVAKKVQSPKRTYRKENRQRRRAMATDWG